ncbi:AraC family transcriptional regulator [Levilactobacillus fujinensis]|uniref:Helix-turn-helix domain-containing protein n=1 Tax=Levilactobacillus fujinensis TaxID=2486024 RepID=A0ABW1THA3_9LACO|nr:AraC family transcriptional regulator [Levilactobacillus fujinensis]
MSEQDFFVHKNLRTEREEKVSIAEIRSTRQSDYDISLETFEKGATTNYFYRYTLNKNSAFSMNTQESKYFEKFNLLHAQNYFVLICPLKGELSVNLDGHVVKLNEGDVCIVDKNLFHTEVARQNEVQTFFLNISADLMRQLFNNRFVYFHRSGAVFDFFQQTLDETTTEKQALILKRNYSPAKIASVLVGFSAIEAEFKVKQSGFVFMLKGLLVRLLDALANGNLYTGSAIRVLSPERNIVIQQVKQLIDLREAKISYVDLGAALKYNGNYLNRLFQKEYGLSIKQYSNIVCIRRADYLLINSNKSVKEIISQLGFTNRTSFNRLFQQKHGMGPAEYRKEHQVH